MPKKVKKEVIIEPPLPETPPEPKPLTEDALYFWTDIPERLSTTVPPPTPTGVDNVLILPFPIPETFPSLDGLDVPFVREIGIKASIDLLGQHLGLTNYTFDYIQFWLLDVLVDCLWRTQDEYFFTKPDQKLVLEWMLYMFRVMRDPTISFSRKQLLKLFKEAILMTGQLIQEGHKVIPKPDDLFELVFQNNPQRDDEDEILDDETSNSSAEEESSDSESTFTISKTNSEHVILMDIGGQQRKYILKRRVCSCEQGSTPTFGTTLTKDITKSTEVSLVYDSYTDEEEGLEGEYMSEVKEETIETFNEPFQNKDYKMFHVVDQKLPSRFLPLPDDDQTEETSQQSYSNPPDYEPPCQIVGDVILLDSNTASSSSTQTTSSQETVKVDSQINDKSQSTTEQSVMRTMTFDEKMKLWRQFKQREQELKDMEDSNVGVVTTHHHHHAHLEPYGHPHRDKPKPLGSALKDHTQTMLRQMLADMKNDDEKDDQESCGLDFEHKTKNLSILCAIIDFVFDYFYQNFHFILLKLALKTNPSIITQKVNPEWLVPKFNLVELVKPKPTPVKKEKKSKEKKSKKDKKSSKKGKDKKKDKKSDKKKGKEKKEKPKKPTKEELKAMKAEQLRQQLLQEQLEEEMRKAEENRRCMFPLADAATDELYMGLFENWQKPKEGKQKKDKKKK
ncbi:uncharacterized protein [Onthophagus taurus]|uniref:uncharacterized protein n=1 Tax=Onthophagus taurus TaxID=166361 RepID=UPI0039BEA9BE